MKRRLVVVDDDKKVVRAVRAASALLRARSVMNYRRCRRSECLGYVANELFGPRTDRRIQTRSQCGAQAGVSYHRRRRIPFVRGTAQPVYVVSSIFWGYDSNTCFDLQT